MITRGKYLDYCIFYFSIRATSPDETPLNARLVTEWKVITASALDSKNHTRLDFQLSSNINSSLSSCELELNSSSPLSVVLPGGGWWWVVVVVGGWYAGNHRD